MIKSKYNYDETANLLKTIADTTQEISRKDLMISLTGRVIEDKRESTQFSAALNNLKTRRLKKLNIDIIPNSTDRTKITKYSNI